jgi:hypothetical protein
MSERAPALDQAPVEAFVANAHGNLDEVRSALAERPAHPEMRDARGPHGIPLRAHAEAGGERAQGVLALLG